MIISFRCQPELKKRIDGVIGRGLYADMSSFCETAVENQLLLEKEGHAQQKITERSSRRPSSQKDGAKRRSQKKQPGLGDDSGVSGGTEEKTSDSLEGYAGGNVPDELQRRNLPQRCPFEVDHRFADIYHKGDSVPIDRWLFGQYNRMLPAKVSCRALAVLSAEGREALELSAVASRISEIASRFGEYLRVLDEKFDNHRDEMFRTAFPEMGVQGEKGRLRYHNHFVGHIVKGEQGGMLIALKLASIQIRKNRPHIFPTLAGWQFAEISNPLIDGAADEKPARMSEKEIRFLLQHIWEHVPVELFSSRVVLTLISQGQNTPDSLNQGLARFLGPGKALSKEQDYVSTQRNGVLGRLTDLGLVGRERTGTRISYQLTKQGEKYLDQIGKIKEGDR